MIIFAQWIMIIPVLQYYTHCHQFLDGRSHQTLARGIHGVRMKNHTEGNALTLDLDLQRCHVLKLLHCKIIHDCLKELLVLWTVQIYKCLYIKIKLLNSHATGNSNSILPLSRHTINYWFKVKNIPKKSISSFLTSLINHDNFILKSNSDLNNLLVLWTSLFEQLTIYMY